MKHVFVFVLAIVCCLVVQPAQAADTVIGFDDLPSGTVVTNQYATAGIVFGWRPGCPVAQWESQIIQLPAGVAQSGTQVLNISTAVEVSSTGVCGHFSIARQHVSVFIGDWGVATHPVTLAAYDVSGVEIAEKTVTVTGGAGIHTPLTVSSSSENIFSFSIFIPEPPNPFARVAIDDFSFDNPATPPPPDFAMNLAPVGNVQILPGQSLPVPLILQRVNLSSGNISLSISGLPSGVGGNVVPNPTNGGDGSLITLNLSAAPGATAAQSTVTVTGTPSSPSAGTAPRSLQFTLVVLGTYVLRVKGIELTQGTQNFGVPSRGPNLAAPITYSGVQLGSVSTLVRVFADAVGAPPGGVAVTVLLHGFDTSNKELSGSPTIPVSGPATLTDSGNAGVTQAEQINANTSFDFILPWQWASPGPLTLKAEIIPPVPSFDHSETAVPCSDSLCMVFRTLTMSGIPFTPTPQPFVYIDPVLLHVNGQPDPPDPWTAFALASLATPTRMAINPTYVGTVDVTDHAGENFSDATNDSWYDLEDWWDDVGGMVSPPYLGPAPYFTIGVTGQLNIGVEDTEEDHPIAVTFAGRPLTSVTHELHHCFGRRHASSACGADKAESWPPDQKGFLNGVGIDMRGSPPFKILAAGVPGEPVNQCAPANTSGWPGSNGQWYDFMGYCPCAASGDPDSFNSWISPKGWGEFWFNPNSVNLGGAVSSAQSEIMAALSRTIFPRPASQPAAASVGETLRVRAYVSNTGVHIAIVKKVPNGRAFTPPASSPYHLLVRDAAGHTVTEVAMATKEVSVMHSATVLSLSAEVPTKPGIESVAITKDGKVVAERARPQQLPQLQIETPQMEAAPPGAMPGPEGAVLIRWQAVASAQNRVTATVDYSIDDGHTWRVLYKGPNRNQVQLPQRYFAGSSNARVRVRISDGFNEVSAVSNSFTTPHLPPTGHILEPSRGAKLKSGVPVELVGKAVDERMKPILDAAMHWFRNDLAGQGREISLGTGERLTVPSLPPGPNIIRLEARDAQDRVGMASVEVNVAANPPEFLVLDAPRVVSRTARQVTIRVASSVPATLTFHRSASPPPRLLLLDSHLQIAGLQQLGTFQVGPQPTTITLNIPAGPEALYVDFSLQADGGTTSHWVAIGREPDPCQSIEDTIQSINQEITTIQDELSNPDLPPGARAALGKQLRLLNQNLSSEETQLKNCEQQHQ